jgi:signal transduction histidine kinase
MNVRKQTESELRKHRDHLEDIVAERTSEITKNSLEKEKLQDQLAQSQKMEALGSLVGGLAHDFNNFLSGIIGSFDLLSRDLENEQLKKRDSIEKYLHLGMESSQRSAGLINQLLILSKRHEIKLSPLDIKNSLNHIHELCRNSFPKSIELNFRAEEAPLIIMGDTVQIEQVLLNLCINASHAMTIMLPPGVKHGGTLMVTAEKIESDYFMKESYPDTKGPVGYWIRINVSDTGIGIDHDAKKESMNRSFQRKMKVRDWDSPYRTIL